LELGLNTAIRVYQITKSILFSGFPFEDCKDRLALVTVAAGLRKAAVFDSPELETERLRTVLIDVGFITLRAKKIWVRPSLPLRGFKQQYVDIFEARHQPSRTPVLWVTTTKTEKDKISAVESSSDAGRVLQYPACCVRENIEEIRLVNESFLKALIKQVGENPQKIKAALKNNVSVELDIPDSIARGGNVELTNKQYPFVFHVACNSCLSSSDSPSATLNSHYQQLATDIDPKLRDAIFKLISVMDQLKDGQTDAERAALMSQMIDIRSRLLSSVS
jgi:hypothetical protein